MENTIIILFAVYISSVSIIIFLSILDDGLDVEIVSYAIFWPLYFAKWLILSSISLIWWTIKELAGKNE